MLNKKELTDEELNKVDGGYLYSDGTKHVWQVIDDQTGDVVVEFLTYITAESYAKSRGYSTEVLEWNELDKLRKNAKK